MKPLVATWASYFNTDPDFGKTMGPDMVLGSGGVWMSPWHQVAMKVIQIGMDPASAWPPDTNMAPDLSSHRTFNGNTDPLAAVGSWTHAWLSAAALAWASLWHWVAVKATQICLALVAAWPLATNMDSGG